jgi:NAD(P)-dependent dehydrogenase (short-subunit alcohol dehydrogenase family)
LEAYKLDLRSSKSIQNAVDWVVQKTDGKINVLFNNGAYGQPGAVEDLTREVLKEQFETNVFGTQELTNMILPYMRKNGFGRVVYNSSVLGIISMAYRGAYNASKYAIEGLCDTLRLEFKSSNIDVILIEPGPIRSDFRKNALKKFQENIDVKSSVHVKVYEKTLERLEGEGDAPFTLGEVAVYDALIKAITSKKPKARYRVTFPTKLFWFLRRVLSTKMLDKVLGSVE